MSDDELRRLLRTRRASPGDADLSRRTAALAARTGDRDLAVNAWQDVLRARPRDPEATRCLVALGCELLFKHGLGEDEVFESIVDHGLLVRARGMDAYVSARPVTYIQFQLFQDDLGNDPEAIAPWQRKLAELKPESPVNEVSWAGANAYARWAGGRLLTQDEFGRVARSGASFEWDRDKGEWIDGENDLHERPAARVRRGEGTTIRWYPGNVWAPVTFRYARASLFRDA